MPAAFYNKVIMSSKPSIAESKRARQNLMLALLLLFVVGAWGANYVITKIAVRTNGPWAFNAFRYTTAAALLAAWLCTQNGWRSLMPARGEFRQDRSDRPSANLRNDQLDQLGAHTTSMQTEPS